MDFEEEKGAFEVEDTTESTIKLGNETGSPPLVVVVQGGKNVRI